MESFYWIKDNFLAGCSYPLEYDNFSFLKNQKMDTIVNLTEKPDYIENPILKHFNLIHIPIEDYSVPTFDQIKQIWKLYQKALEKEEKIVFHCAGGCGRTGTIIVILLLLSDHSLKPDQALTQVREIRPCSVETKEQEQFILEIASNREEFEINH